MKYFSIAILTWGLASDGLTNYAVALAKGFQDMGIKELSLLYISATPGQNVAIPEGVKLVSLGVQRARWTPFHLARFLREVKPDILITLSAFISIPAIFGWLLAGRTPTKLIVSEHSTMSYKSYIEYKDDLWMRAQPGLARLLYPIASGLHTNSPEVLDDLLMKIRVPIQNNRAIAISNPVNIEAISNYSRVAPEHPWLQHKEKTVIISVGRLAKQKNFPLLLKAFAIVQKQLDAKLIILGEGPERQNLENLITELHLEQDVSLPGFSENPWSSMAKADIFVLPSEEEPFGLVLVEAMACGVPVVATDAIGGGPRVILENEKYGILVPSNNAARLVESISKVITSKALRDQLVTAGKQRCEAFRPQIAAHQWLEFLEQL